MNEQHSAPSDGTDGISGSTVRATSQLCAALRLLGDGEEIPTTIDAAIRKIAARVIRQRYCPPSVLDEGDAANTFWQWLGESAEEQERVGILKALYENAGSNGAGRAGSEKNLWMTAAYRQMDNIVNTPARTQRRRLNKLRRLSGSMTAEMDPGNDEQVEEARARVREIRTAGGINIDRFCRHHIDGQTVPEIAESDAVSEAAVYKSFPRAEAEIRKKYPETG